MSVSMCVLLLVCLITEAGREFCFKHAADASTLFKTLQKPMIWLGIVLWAVELVSWINVLAHVPLSIAFPLMSLVYVVILFGGAVLFKEPITKRHALGALLIAVGVACVGATGV